MNPGLLTLLILSVLLPGCTGQPPEIRKVFWQANLVEDREKSLLYLELSLFVKPDDPDGSEDLEELFLINDEKELFWRLDSETWQKSGAGEDIWIGSNGIRMPDGSPLSAGEYRVLLRDVGGDSAEQTIRLPAFSVEESRRLIPQVAVTPQEIRIRGKSPSYILWLYRPDGTYAGLLPVAGGRQEMSSVLSAYPALSGGFRFKVYAYFEKEKMGVVTGPFFVTP